MATPSDPYPWREPTKPIARGALIVIEGLDRSGKTTQVKKLCNRLYSEGHNIKTFRFPDRTSPTGHMINNYLQSSLPLPDQTIHLLFSSNRWEKSSEILSFLSSGYTIVLDRYIHSGQIYTLAKNNPLITAEWARSPDIGLPKADVTIFLDLEPEEAEKRGGFGEERYEVKEMQEKVREGFRGLLAREGEGIVRIDAGGDVENVGEKIFEVVKEVKDRVERDGGEVGRVGL